MGRLRLDRDTWGYAERAERKAAPHESRLMRLAEPKAPPHAGATMGPNGVSVEDGMEDGAGQVKRGAGPDVEKSAWKCSVGSSTKRRQRAKGVRWNLHQKIVMKRS